MLNSLRIATVFAVRAGQPADMVLVHGSGISVQSQVDNVKSTGYGELIHCG